MSIEIKGVSKAFGDTTVLDDFNLSLPEKGLVCLIGGSGSGKTTLLRIIAGLERPDCGMLFGIENKKISYVFQEDRLVPKSTALENVAIVSDKKSAEYWLNEMELGDSFLKKPSELSGGMRRRVALARGFAFDGDILLLDEPFTGLDRELKEKIFTMIKITAKKALVILVTHDVSDTKHANKIVTIE